ncbi:hypothetical protein [Ferrimonas aestuarii]|uniref:Uncharacterized protein n=1 Tax=Ferrimonas aestuarii TaxID=2569539 RepID=A0A4U1BMS6_9GAMM|nr:hypothetical protein [Ferrimonas aestuarii]TKB54227.1 hypothetical protein FCL42_12585 [Ferrimonas aestuarii]
MGVMDALEKTEVTQVLDQHGWSFLGDFGDDAMVVQPPSGPAVQLGLHWDESQNVGHIELSRPWSGDEIQMVALRNRCPSLLIDWQLEHLICAAVLEQPADLDHCVANLVVLNAMIQASIELQ